MARKQEAIVYYGIEGALALFVSLGINVAVVSVFADGFYGKGVASIGLENAGRFLGDRFGIALRYIWAVGLLAAGMHPKSWICYSLTACLPTTMRPACLPTTMRTAF